MSKKCKICKEPFTPQYSTTEVVCRNSDCRYQYAMKSVESKRKEAKKEWNREKKQIKEGLKSITGHINDVRRIFQIWIRQRDNDLPCISCGCVTAKQWDAGHYLKAELYTGLIFNEDNCHKQCSQCNDFHGGKLIEYRIGLVKKIGIERVEWLENNKDRLRQYRFSRSELDEIKKDYQSRLKNNQSN